MSEVEFAKSLLSAMDRKAIKLSSDFISDPKKYPAQSPYTLPKPTHPFPRKRPAGAETPGSTTAVAVNLKPVKATREPLKLPAQDLNTTILDLKTDYAQKAGLDMGKVKLLYNKRPVSDLKTLKELLPTPTPGNVELSVMIMGGGVADPTTSTTRVGSPAVEIPEIPDPTALPSKTERSAGAPLSEKAEAFSEIGPNTAQDPAEILKSDLFWIDLKDFLVQRLRDEEAGERLLTSFKSATSP